jgi:O-antigen/teichoic acid export membrane protein
MFIKNIYIRLGTNVIVEAINFIISILLFRAFGAPIVGLIAYYYGLAGICSLFTDLGISTAYSKFVASEDNYENITAYFFLKSVLIGLYTIIFLGVFAFKWRTGDIDEKLLFILFAGFLLDLIGQMFIATFVGKRDFAYLSRVEITSSVILAVYNLIVCFLIRDKYFLAGSKILFPLAIITGGVLFFYRNKLLRFEAPRWNVIKKYLSYSMPIAFSSVVSQFTTYFDKLIVGKLVGMNELGLYQIASRFYASLDNFVKPITNTMFTEIVHKITNIPKFFHNKFSELVQVLNFFGGLLALAVIFFSTPMITYILKPENVRSAFILKFFMLALLAKLFWRPYDQVVYALDKHKWTLYPLPAQLVIMIACYYLLIPIRINDFYLGSAAIPLTEFITWLVPAGFIRIWVLKKEYGNLHMLETIVKTGVPLVILLAIGYLCKFSLAIFPLILAAYFAISYIFNILTKERWNQLVEPFNLAILKI